jgi:hypothetical protein
MVHLIGGENKFDGARGIGYALICRAEADSFNRKGHAAVFSNQA